jgi:hypothetical protein
MEVIARAFNVRSDTARDLKNSGKPTMPCRKQSEVPAPYNTETADESDNRYSAAGFFVRAKTMKWRKIRRFQPENLLS